MFAIYMYDKNEANTQFISNVFLEMYNFSPFILHNLKE